MKFATMIRIMSIAIALSFMAASGPAPAQENDVFDRLQKEPVTLFDLGIKRLRSSARIAADRLSPPSDPKVKFRVFFDQENRRLVVRFEVGTFSRDVSQAACWERRVAAIKETFAIGRTRYTVTISVEERIRRKLGVMFSREPSTDKNMIALGQRLAELTIVEVILRGTGPKVSVSCSALSAELKPK
ncbi:MAG: hypothetical protein HQ513_00225 [Rhodospirillales bacterium]|nr:hypothetical protein [Rhodospirillales bacterium]